MLFVFDLSKPLDFFPIYSNPIPLENFNKFGITHLERAIDTITTLNPETNFLVVENIEKSTFDYPPYVREILFIKEELNLFEKLFLISSFITSCTNETKVIFLKGNIIIEKIENFFKTIKKILSSHSNYTLPVIFFSFKNEIKNSFLEIADIIEKNEKESFYLVKDILKIIDPQKKNKNLLNFCEVFYFHALKLKEIFCREKESSEIYFECEEMWNKKTFYLEEWNKIIGNIKTLEIKTKILSEGVVATNIESEAGIIEKIRDLFKIFNSDENNNLIKGKVIYNNLKNSIVINESNSELYISNMSDVLVLKNEQLSRIEKLL
jgi:hypothetical protein